MHFLCMLLFAFEFPCFDNIRKRDRVIICTVLVVGAQVARRARYAEQQQKDGLSFEHGIVRRMVHRHTPIHSDVIAAQEHCGTTSSEGNLHSVNDTPSRPDGYVWGSSLDQPAQVPSNSINALLVKCLATRKLMRISLRQFLTAAK
eukprot:scaffold11976_cov120-Cylindrotheca_fusiformis.AAC.4